MGYAQAKQVGKGLHTRCFSRAYVVEDTDTSTRVAFVTVDVAMMSQIAKIRVVEMLEKALPGMYNASNVAVSGTHTHSAPGGYLQYLLFGIAAKGFYKQSLELLVEGIVDSIVRAHNSRAAGTIRMATGELEDANINRSPSAYLNNPAEERSKYKADTDFHMVQLRLTNTNGTDIGALNWFAVHCTSMNNTNVLVSSDNKGHASYLMERENNNGSLPGQGSFVAGFASSNLGDVSPNVNGTFCLDSGLPCDFNTSTCHGKNELCVGRGPGQDMFDSTRIIGERQYNKAKELFDNATTVLQGPVDFRHSFVDMTNVSVVVDGNEERTCPPAMGYSFAAGTTDGPGAFNFEQGDTSTNPFWNAIVHLIAEPTQAQKDCHHPKPILLDTGEIKFPYLWQPRIVDIQVFRLGQLVLLNVPGEFTTMSGRRLRETVREVLIAGGLPPDTEVVIAGLTNTYSDYITTFEEYQVQRYEGASTVYGPHTLSAYTQLFTDMVKAMLAGSPVPEGPSPPDLSAHQLDFITPVIEDTVPWGQKFGDLVKDVNAQYTRGEIAEVTFWSANPRNDPRTGQSFLTIERETPAGAWEVVYTDADWCTRFLWERVGGPVSAHSQATVRWDIEESTLPGSYRIKIFASSKQLFTGKLTPFEGVSSTFQVK